MFAIHVHVDMSQMPTQNTTTVLLAVPLAERGDKSPQSIHPAYASPRKTPAMQARSCSGPVSRRSFLQVGSLALGGLTLADLLAARAASGAAPIEAEIDEGALNMRVEPSAAPSSRSERFEI